MVGLLIRSDGERINILRTVFSHHRHARRVRISDVTPQGPPSRGGPLPVEVGVYRGSAKILQ